MSIDHKKTYEEFLEDVSLTSGVAGIIVEKVAKAIFECIAQSVALDEQVRIPKFGSFTPVQKAGRTFKAINTGKEMELPPYKAMHFKPSKTLTARIQEPKTSD